MKYSTDLVQHYTKIQKTIMQNAECNLSEAFAFLLLHYETGSCLVSKQSFNALATKTPSHKVSQMLSCRYGFAAF